MSADAFAPQYDVFISYARADANMGAAPLDSALKRDFRVWRDVRDLDPAQDFTAELEQAIKASKYVVVCITPDVERTDSFVRREIGFASYLKKPILVARFAEMPPPINVFNHTWIDFFAGWDSALSKLMRWLRGDSIDSAAPTTSAPIPAPDPYRAYVERLYADVVESLRASVVSTETITLRAVESVGDVPRKKPRLNLKFVPYVLRETSEPAPTEPKEFDSLHEAYASTDCDGRVLLLGEPGSGKTTTLLAVARDAAAARLSDASQPLPIFARISGWNHRDETPLAEWLTTGEDGISAKTLQRLIEQRKTLLLLDGLDELGESRRAETSKTDSEQYDPRERFLRILPTTSGIILSSRVEEYRQIGQQANLNCAVRLQRLNDSQMRDYLADVADLWDVIRSDVSLKEALQTPLLLALFRVGFEETPEEARGLHNLSFSDLNDRIWDVFINKRWAFEQARSSKSLRYSPRELKTRLADAAIAALDNDLREDYTRILAEDVGEEDAEEVIELAMRLDLLQSAGSDRVYLPLFQPSNRNTFRFLHLRLRDTLVLSSVILGIKSQNSNSSLKFVDVILHLGKATAIEFVHTRSHDMNAHIRDLASHVQHNLRRQEEFELLIEHLQDPDSEFRVAAAEALGNRGDGRAIDPLIEVLQHDPDVDVRLNAAIALERLGGPRGLYALIVALRDFDDEVRRMSAEALGNLGYAAAIEPLIEALTDKYDDVRSTAAQALEQFEDDPRVQTALSDYYYGRNLMKGED